MRKELFKLLGKKVKVGTDLKFLKNKDAEIFTATDYDNIINILNSLCYDINIFNKEDYSVILLKRY